MAWYTGQTYRGVDYSATWPGWNADPAKVQQLRDADFANDAFASLWGKGYQAPAGGPSVPINNGANYRDDLGTIAHDGFNLVRLYDWGMARGTTATNNNGLDHINFLNYASSLGIKVVVPVSNYFMSNDQYAWNSKTPDANYSFNSAPDAIKLDFKQFVASITDPLTHKINAGVHSISIGNETEIGTGPIAQPPPTSASDFLARINWWIYNLHQQINGTGTGPDGDPVVNGASGATIPISATFANGDQTGKNGSWFKALLFGVAPGDGTPSQWFDGTNTFTKTVKGLATIDPGFASYYYNSFNIGQSSPVAPFNNGIAGTLALYDSQALPWTGPNGNVPLLLMEVFTPNRGDFPKAADQAQAAVNEVITLEKYLAEHKAGTADSTTNLLGYNYFSFQDEPAISKLVGLYQYTGEQQGAQTGTTSLSYGTFPNLTFPVYKLVPTAGPDGPNGKTLAQAWAEHFPSAPRNLSGTAANDVLNGSAGSDNITAAAGNDTINGGAGIDTAVSLEPARNFAVRTAAGSSTLTLQDKVEADGTDSLTNVEFIQFRDMTVDAASITKTASLPADQILKVIDLYTAGLDRAPDAVGLAYWASQVADGASMANISKVFFGAPEAAPLYSSNNSSSVFVDQTYLTALGRTPDAGGAAYWLNELATGHIQRTDFVTSLIAGARGAGGSAADAAYIANKEAVGAHFALAQGLTNVTWARTVESAVNGTAASVTAANAATDAFAATAATAAGSELVVQIVGVVA